MLQMMAHAHDITSAMVMIRYPGLLVIPHVILAMLTYTHKEVHVENWSQCFHNGNMLNV